MSFRVLGIDPGLDGGMTTLEMTERNVARVVSSEPMPTIGGVKGKRSISLAGVKSILTEAQPDLVVMERVFSRPGQSISAMFNFGHGLGVIEGIIFTLGLKSLFVLPQAWQKVVLKGLPRDMDKPSILFCQREFPLHDWRGTERSRTLHDGKTDSCCIAYYGITQHS